MNEIRVKKARPIHSHNFKHDFEGDTCDSQE